MKEKGQEVVGGVTIKYHANGKTTWSKGKIIDGKPEGYWEWFRPDGTINVQDILRMASQLENG